MTSGKVDIFCKVVDNFGDIGVAWRLARQLVAEQGFNVRLWLDNPDALSRLSAEVDAQAEMQTVCGVEVRHWGVPFPEAVPAEVVVETFGCDLPESYVIAMAHQARPPAWINLDYLSAEAWVDSHHALPSPHPRLPLTKHFYFPGFSDKTGGLLRERDLLARRGVFQRDQNAQLLFWEKFDMPPPAQNELRISLFCYENPCLPELLQAWADGSQPITCLVPEGVALESLAKFFKVDKSAVTKKTTRGKLTLQYIPFTDQGGYDQLLWACDVNFARGEDSFVRAQWAAKPFVWHIYPQKENTHWVKLNAFIDLYAAAMSAEQAAATREFWRAFNAGRGAGVAWNTFVYQLPGLLVHNRAWAEQLSTRIDLSSGLADFCRKLIK
ncbi:MAG: elongation factor P maturation arginine rhamnosyltransferase EarP [Burkholderiales bacterium]